MTTNIQVLSASDLSCDNEVMNLIGLQLPDGKSLSGTCWFIKDSVAQEALLSVLRFIYPLIVKKIPDHLVWLIVGNQTWQPDTRIIRHRKLWRMLAARGIEISHAFNEQEIVHELNGKVKFFGAKQLSELSVGSVTNVLLKEKCAYMIALPSSVEPKGLLNIGWSGDLKEDFKFIASLSESNGLLFQRMGAFDDRENGIIAIGQPELIKLLISNKHSG